MKYNLLEILDISRLQAALDSLYLSSNIPSAIIDVEGRIHTTSGWQDVCTKFHRVHPEARKLCNESTLYSDPDPKEATPLIHYRCPHGLVDSSIPIIIGGEHIGSVFSGQLFLEDPDLDFFRDQARSYGFDEEKYIEAVKKVPVITEQALRENLSFIAHLTGMLAEMGMKRSKEREIEQRLRESEESYRTLFREMLDGFALHEIVCDGHGKPVDYRFLAVNPAFERMTGLRSEEVVGRTVLEVLPDTESFWIDTYGKVALTGKPAFFTRYAADLKKHFEVSAFRTAINHFACIVADITERKRAEAQVLKNKEDLRKLAGHLQEKIEEERKRIAREIHDELGQQLAALKNDLAWAESHIPESVPRLLGKVRSMAELVDATSRSVYSIIHKLRPLLLDDLGLPEAIDWQISEFRKRTGIACELDAVLDDLDLEPDAVTGVFRLLQEMLTNVGRHSGAKRCRIRIRKRSDEIFLLVVDDGSGAPAARIDDPASFGLLGMRERSRALGGRFRIRGFPGKGTIVAVLIPVRASGVSRESDEEPPDAH